ncbi:hypothetical protein D3C85_1726950 [compost metagenome]
MLVVLHQHFVDACAQLAGHAGDFTLDVGVIGAFIKTTVEEPVGKQSPGNQQDNQQEGKQATLELGRHGQTVVEKL